jgi:diguanylate cyclase (GGDEF)-like protein
VGDLALEHFASLLMAAVAGRKALIGRRGGEEFAILLTDCNGDDGRQVAEQVRFTCEQAAVPAQGRLLRLTVSLGVAARVNPGEPLAKLLARADAALYEAKRAGRNRVVACAARGEASLAA